MVMDMPMEAAPTITTITGVVKVLTGAGARGVGVRLGRMPTGSNSAVCTSIDVLISDEVLVGWIVEPSFTAPSPDRDGIKVGWEGAIVEPGGMFWLTLNGVF